MTQIIVWLNVLAGWIAEYTLAPIAILPGWLSATLVAVVSGVLMLFVFKYTSNQGSVKQVRNGIKANLLALSLFQDNLVAGLRCQARVLAGAFRLLRLAVVPVLVMTLPMCLLLAQLALWYQARPLHVDEEAALTVHLAEKPNGMPDMKLAAVPGGEVTIGPVRVPSKQIVCWSIRAREAGRHRLALQIGEQWFTKEYIVGEGFKRVSLRRPSWNWSDALLHPRESPFSSESVVQAIAIDYPDRDGWVCGSGSWIVYWFVVSMIAAFLIRPWLRVTI